MGCGSSIHTDKRVVIVGGGYAGVKVAMALKDYNIVLIDAKDSFVHNVANVRAVVEPALIEKIYINYSFTFGEKFIQGRVSSVDAEHQQVILENQQQIPYDILVLATGCKGRVEVPTKLWSQSKKEAQEMFNAYNQKVVSSQRIAVVGAGAVGVEIAAELASRDPGKDVLLVGSSHELIQPGLSAKLQTKLKAILEGKLKCKLVLGSRVENMAELTASDTGPYTIQLADGSSHEVDLVIPCLGLEVNSTAYTQGLASSMDDHGALKVNEYLQVEGHDDIFALGDCTNIQERKLTMNAQNQADTFLKNLKQLVEGKAMKPYKPDQIPVKVAVSLGPNSGLGESSGGSVLPEFIITKLKSKGLFIEKSWKDMKQKMPK